MLGDPNVSTDINPNAARDVNGCCLPKPSLERYGLLLVVFAICGVVLGASGSIQDIDFKNFAYPFVGNGHASVPSKLKWVATTLSTKHIPFREGQYRFPCDESPCPWLTFDQAVFGTIQGLPGKSAVVVTVYHTGGSATWQYLYIIAIRSSRPEVVALLETGSRADMGLRRVTVDHGDVVLTVNDPAKREGDCCSLGTITYRYRWHGGSFQQIGEWRV